MNAAELIAIRTRAGRACYRCFPEDTATEADVVRALGESRAALRAVSDELDACFSECDDEGDVASIITLKPVAEAIFALHTAAELASRPGNLDTIVGLVQRAAKSLTIDASENGIDV